MTGHLHLPAVHAANRLHTVAGVVAVLLVLTGAALHPVTTVVAAHDVRATVADTTDDITMGVSVDADRIDFGTVPADTMIVERTVNVTNNDARDKTLHLSVTGNASTHVTLQPATVTVPAGDTAPVTVRWNSTDAAPGIYTGTLRTTEDRPLWEVLWS